MYILDLSICKCEWCVAGDHVYSCVGEGGGRVIITLWPMNYFSPDLREEKVKIRKW